MNLLQSLRELEKAYEKVQYNPKSKYFLNTGDIVLIHQVNNPKNAKMIGQVGEILVGDHIDSTGEVFAEVITNQTDFSYTVHLLKVKHLTKLG